MNNTKVQLACAWCAPIAITLFGLGLWPIAGLVPPPSPSTGPLELQQIYAENPVGIRLGLIIVAVAGGLTAPFVSLITAQMRRITGPESPLPNLQLGMGMLGIMLFLWPILTLQAAVYRPDRNPDLIVLASDMAWLSFVGIFTLVCLQSATIAVCTFLDHDSLVFPRWVAYLNIWAALLFLPAGLIFFFKEGPFAWNGVIAFWVPAVAFAVWFYAMFVALRNAILRQEREARSALAER
jgi:hypothetical protein